MDGKKRYTPDALLSLYDERKRLRPVLGGHSAKVHPAGPIGRGPLDAERTGRIHAGSEDLDPSAQRGIDLQRYMSRRGKTERYGGTFPEGVGIDAPHQNIACRRYSILTGISGIDLKLPYYRVQVIPARAPGSMGRFRGFEPRMDPGSGSGMTFSAIRAVSYPELTLF